MKKSSNYFLSVAIIKSTKAVTTCAYNSLGNLFAKKVHLADVFVFIKSTI